jgi:hypothetical protein
VQGRGGPPHPTVGATGRSPLPILWWALVLLVHAPSERIVGDVLADSTQVILVPDDVLVVVALPNGEAWGSSQYVDSLGCGGFEPDDE